jgi:hypothetical protein
VILTVVPSCVGLFELFGVELDNMPHAVITKKDLKYVLHPHTYHRKLGSTWKEIARKDTSRCHKYCQDVRASIDVLVREYDEVKQEQPGPPSIEYVNLLNCLGECQGSESMIDYTEECRQGKHNRLKIRWTDLILKEITVYEYVLKAGHTDEVTRCKSLMS